MPWKASRPVDLKVEFVTRLRCGERMSDLCREYQIHRQTGYEVLRRYEAQGLDGLLPQRRGPKRLCYRISEALRALIVDGRKAHPTWGPKKLKCILEEQHGVRLPASSTIGDILVKAGLVKRRKRVKRTYAQPTLLRQAVKPNDVWCCDYKGQFRLGDRSYCYPLTVTDQFSRYLLGCEGMAAIDQDAALQAFVDVFRKYGLPEAMRSDNGVPFASTGLANLTQLSVLWLRLGIQLERIKPGHPEQNGRHERMHRTLKRETAAPPQTNLLQQQEKFDRFVKDFNTQRPHEALGQRPPASVYVPSQRKLPKQLPELDYPLHDDVLRVDAGGSVKIHGHRYYLSAALAHQNLGLLERGDGCLALTFIKLELGLIDPRAQTFIHTAASAA